MEGGTESRSEKPVTQPRVRFYPTRQPLVERRSIGQPGGTGSRTSRPSAARQRALRHPPGGRNLRSSNKSSVFKQSFSAEDWVVEHDAYRLKARIFIARELWRPWRPTTVFVSGHVRKSSGEPVPFVKVDIYDVDRDGFLWPYLMELPKRQVVRIHDLLALGPQPEPPDLQIRPVEVKLPVAESAAASVAELEAAGFMQAVSISPQPEPPLQLATGMTRVGEMAAASPALADKLEGLTVTSKAAFWQLFPRRFYSKQLVDTVYTDHQGHFCATFGWRPFELRLGRLRFDYRPDIIVKVTQVIDGVEKVLYMDPYSSTRWNVPDLVPRGRDGKLYTDHQGAERHAGGQDDVSGRVPLSRPEGCQRDRGAL